MSGLNLNNNNSDYPLTNILHPGTNDILCGRGGATNAHPGNIKFRKLVAAHKLRYLAATKCDKPAVAKDVVREWRAMDPPGRFLAKMENSGGGGSSSSNTEGADTDNSKSNAKSSSSSSSTTEYWYDIGDKKAREKASQCLRERNGAANEVVANLVKAVTASGEACPEDYATLINKASAVIQAQQQQQQQQQQQAQQLQQVQSGQQTNNDAMMFQQQQQQQRGVGYGGGGGGGSSQRSGKSPSPDTPPTEDDFIEAEIQRLLKLKHHQNSNGNGNTNNGGNNVGFNGGTNGMVTAGGGNGILSNDDIMPTPYMGEESVMREYENLMRKQREIDRMRGVLNDAATSRMGGGGGGGGGLGNDNNFMMAGNINTNNNYGMMNNGMTQHNLGRGGMLNNMGSQGGDGSNNNNDNMFHRNSNLNNPNMDNNNNNMGGGGENNQYNLGMGNNFGGGTANGRTMPSSNTHIPDAAKDYINRLRMLRQEGGNGGGGGGGGSGGSMQDPMSSFQAAGGPHRYSDNGNMRDNTTGNMGGFSGGDNMNNSRRMSRGLGSNGGGGEFVEEYQASLQQFLSHNGDFGVDNIDGNRSEEAFRRASRKFSETTQRAGVGARSSSAQQQQQQQQQQGRPQFDTITCIQIPTNLEDGHRSYNRRGGGGNRRPSRDDSYLPTLRLNTFGSMDSFARPSFQSMDDIDMRDSFKSVNTMDLMSIGCSINEVYDEDVKINSESWKKYRRRMSAASQVDHNNFGASHLTGLTGLTGLSDFGTLSRPDSDGFGVTSHVVQTKDCDGPSKNNARGSQLSMVLNLDDPDECMRLSFASVLSELSEFNND
ncbi:hypothetical protein ACHAWU_005122 [Discostella pseudostelligera]|uniref:DUF6824 domain-containing protein n=1 Tax=Discostella pseudostelligera TaxID=259834 RepID=A0ABD3LYL7_9STRA